MSSADGSGIATADQVATAVSAENRSVEIEGAMLVYRRFGDGASDAPPLLCLQHFRGNLDNWDPALVDRLAGDREVDPARQPRRRRIHRRRARQRRATWPVTSCASSTRSACARSTCSASRSAATSRRRWRWCARGCSRRIVLAGTAPRGAPRIHRWSDDVYASPCADVTNPDALPRAVLLRLAGQPAEGHGEYLERTSARTADRDEPTDLAAATRS